MGRLSRALLALMIVMAATLALSLGTAAAGSKQCVSINTGTLHDSLGNTLTTGYDQFGYNYGAHAYNGTFDGLDRVLDGTYYGQVGDFIDDHIQMKWSDDWISSSDCNGDGLLDRGTDGVSRGWLTNHVVGDYVDADGQVQRYEDFVKFGYVGAGGDLWGAYTVLQEVYNDTGGGSFRFKAGAPGLGLNDGWTLGDL